MLSEVVFCVVDVSTLRCEVVSDEGVAWSLCETLFDSRDKGLLVDSMLADDASCADCGTCGSCCVSSLCCLRFSRIRGTSGDTKYDKT